MVIAGTLANPRIGEASGLAASRVSPDVLWTLNDSGNEPELFAIDSRGGALATCRIGNARDADWEDLASFRLAGVPYLMIADTGDNDAERDDCALLVVREPGEKERAADRVLTLPVAWTLCFRYEDGPRDCESVAVDAAAGRVLLLSKRTKPPVLYELPLLPGTNGALLVARRVIAVASLPPKVKGRGRAFRTQPTAMDIASDGSALAVLTYSDAYLYERGSGESWAQALTRLPQRIALPSEDDGILKQREALCFGDGSRRLYVTAEGRHAQLGWLDATARPPSAGRQ